MTMKRILTGLAALLLLAGLIVGLPWLLLATSHLGTPAGGWNVGGLWQMLTRPDDGTLFIALIRVVGWVCWAIITTAVTVDIVARLRHLPVPQLRGLNLPQHLAGGLVAAVAALFVATANLSIATPAIASPAGPVAVAPQKAAAPAHKETPTRQHRAERHITVHKGDTLSQIALDATGDANNYPELFQASKHTRQPGGRHLTNPDLILPGWTITIPGHHNTPTPAPAKQTKTDTAAPTKAEPAPTITPHLQPDTTTTQATAAPATAAPEATQPADEASDGDVQPSPAWLLGGLAGAGSLLAGSAWVALRRRRAAQFRHRRPGRAISAPPPELAPVEKTLISQGAPTGDLVVEIDAILRRLATHLVGEGQPLPALVGVDVTPTHLTLRLRAATPLGDPWEAVDGDAGQVWRVNRTAADQIGPLQPDSPSPWPQLVTLGADADGWRLVNLEALGVISLTGDPTYADDLARYLIAELALAPWAADVSIDCIHTCPELTPLAPGRVHYRTDGDAAGNVATAVATADKLGVTGLTLETARATQADEDTWDSHVLVTPLDDVTHLDVLAQLIADQPGRTATSILLVAQGTPPAGIEIHLTVDGRVIVPALDLDLVVNGLTEAEARGCVAVLAAGIADTSMPPIEEAEADWAQYADEAGSLLPDLTLPRDSDTDGSSLLPEPDDTYVAVTANTEEDLEALAPKVPAAVTDRILAADPTLDADVTAWFAHACHRPRLQVLGPVKVRVGAGGDPAQAAARLGFCTEMVAYLASHPNGITTDQAAEAFNLTTRRVRRDITTVRAWLGHNPRTGRPYVPEANRHPLAAQRGHGVYAVEDLLADFDLFRRLRLRGEARGAEGMSDLRTALRLVTGTPFDNLRARGGLWLADTRLDQHLLCAVVDVAHIVATSALQEGDYTQARAAAELAALAAPDETRPQLDLAAVASRQGMPGEAASIARGIIDHTVDGGSPLDQAARTNAILRTHRWLGQAS